MARISLVICDLCKEKIAPKHDGLYEISLIKNGKDAQLEAGEICSKCYRALLNRLMSEEKLKAQSVVTQQSRVIQTQDEPTKRTQSKSGKNIPTDGLEEFELQAIPPSLDLNRGSKDIARLNREAAKKCPHLYKRYKDGAIICTDATDVKGPLAGFKGCGKKLQKNEV